MPWLVQKPPEREPASSWHTVLRNTFTRLLPPQSILPELEELQRNHPATSNDIANVLLGFRSVRSGMDNPLLFRYAEHFLKSKYIKASDLLLALLKCSRYDRGSECIKINDRPAGMSLCEERMFNIVLASQFPDSKQNALELVFAIMRWLKAVSGLEVSKQLENGALHTLDPFWYATYEALSALAITVLSHKDLQGLTKATWWRDRRVRMIAILKDFDDHVLQWMQSRLAGQLRAMTNTIPFIELDKKGMPILTEQQILSLVPQMPVARCRAGMFIWLSAALCGRPLTDDMALLSCLQNRYVNDAQSQIVNLLLASYDLLQNAIFWEESRQNAKAIHSFICNKVPALIAMLAPTLPPPLTTENCIHMAFAHLIFADPFPPLTSGAAKLREEVIAIRLECVRVCVLYGVASENIMETLMLDPVKGPKLQRYNKDHLVALCVHNLGHLGTLLKELDSIPGNAAAISGCIVQMVTNLCVSKDTMSLKTICHQLVAKVDAIDVVLQYSQPVVLLQPLCALLNDWVHDQDQTECTPGYEEFASILLFVLAIIHRYDFENSELGVPAESFVCKLRDDMIVSRPTTELSANESSQLGNWLEGLYAVDEHGETNGIGDEVMKQCSPQSFYSLVSTLFEQSILACRSNKLPIKTFHVGLELLLEPFLLPSLTMGMGWLAQHSWEDHQDAEILLQVLEKLIKPTSNSEDAQIMHGAVLAIVASPLHASLEELRERKPEMTKAKELMRTLKPYLNQQRVFQTSDVRSVLIKESETSQRHLRDSFQNQMRRLIEWAANPDSPQPNPVPRYSRADFVAASQQLDGEVLMQVMLTELAATTPGNMPNAMDICVSLMCAPAPVAVGMQPSRLGSTLSKLRDTVRLCASDLSALKKRPTFEAEMIINLKRRIDEQLAAAQLAPMAMPMPLHEQAAGAAQADQIMQELGLDIADDVAAAQVDVSLNQDGNLADLEQQLDLTNVPAQDLADMAAAVPSNMDLDNSQLFESMDLTMNQAQNGDPTADMQNQEEDIFAGLSGLDMDDLGEDFQF